MKAATNLLILFFLLFFSNQIVAQTNSDTTTIWQITTIDDNEFIGYILSETESAIEFKTATIGTITIQKNIIRKREKLRSNASTNGLLWADNPLPSRYFWANSGYSIKSGEGYYQNTWVLFNHAEFGLTDNFSLGVGTIPLFLFSGTSTPIWVSPKVTFPIQKDQINVGAGMLLGTTLSTDNTEAFGFAFGTTTFGSPDKNISAGFGYGFAEGDWANRPTFTLAGMLRTGKRGYIITENYFIDSGFDQFAILSLGGRFAGKRIIIDYGGIYPTEADTFFIIPWLSITLPFR